MRQFTGNQTHLVANIVILTVTNYIIVLMTFIYSSLVTHIIQQKVGSIIDDNQRISVTPFLESH
jgi:hypothetical protein